ncbi:ferrous iron transport protein B [Desulfovibrio sp. 1188_IL3213]|uniref:ferrous iron transport protein B n=3 Tax=unclassified Desulfovibrio TaxID=2593640 RepID=UPI002FD89EED
MSSPLLAALAGQPNCGKSTLFNMLTGARQHVANYPGVTVEKKTGYFNLSGRKVELVDLPGTYSLTSYSLEEKVARDFILEASPQVTINVADAANLKRHIYLTLQLLEMETPLVLALNMMDVAERRSIKIDVDGLARELGIAVVPTVGKKSSGVQALRAALTAAAEGGPRSAFVVDYGPMEPYLAELAGLIAHEKALAGLPVRWLAVKLLENDEAAVALVQKRCGEAADIPARVAAMREGFAAAQGVNAERHVAFARHRTAAALASRHVSLPAQGTTSLSDKTDRFVCHRFFGPLILLTILLVLYQISIVFGGDVAAMIWPLWDNAQNALAGFLPASGFLEDPLLRSLGVWVMRSVTAILNYLPIFFLLFALIAILEDSGYMPRMAFILDRAFRRFGLHGQSTLPLILGGVYVGGCAIPAVMATRAIPDEKARLATILIAPMMNCLAKVPLYLILISAYFAANSGMAMFFIATITLFMALPVSKALSLTLLRGKPSAPFIMEMPPYHLPTIRGVLSRAIERVWIFVRKIFTVVLAVAVVIFALINFPGLGEERMAVYEKKSAKAMSDFVKAVDKTGLAGQFTLDDVTPLLLFEEALKDAKRSVTDQDASDKIDAAFQEKSPLYFTIVRAVGEDGKALRPALRKLMGARKQLRRELREETFEHSALGMAGKALEPVTRHAGFNWKINIALLSAFAAKENSAATLGAIYGLDGDAPVQDSMREDATGFTPLHALALMLFMALYPPCVPTSVMVRLQSNSTGWMLFSIFYQTCLGLAVATLVFTGGTLLGLSGWQAMWIFYGLCVALTIVMGMIPEPESRKKLDAKKPVTA